MWFNLLLFLVLHTKGVWCLKNVSLHILNPAVSGEEVHLQCRHDLEDDALFSIKWFRDDVEFYRYCPGEYPEKEFFPLRGIRVDMMRSTNGTLVLLKTNETTTGTFKCEVTINDAPSFHTESAKLILRGQHIARKNEPYTPTPAVRGESVRLRCEYDLEYEELLYLAWLKDEELFFLYMPSISIPIPEKGIDVDISKSDNSSVFLRNLTLDNSGNYTCLVATGRPPYRNTIKTARLLEIVEPPSVPVLTTEKSEYELGDIVSILCNSGKSKPAPELKWYINDRPAPIGLSDQKTEVHPDQLESASLSLRLLLRPYDLDNGLLVLKCVATISHTQAMSTKKIGVINSSKGLLS